MTLYFVFRASVLHNSLACRHIISSDTWTKFHLEHLNTSLAVEHISIGRAIQNWLEAVKSGYACI